MSKKALYRKYRSTSFAEILGQEHIVSTLENAIKSGSFSHAYLFTGPRGVGKTSIARLLAHKIINNDYAGDNDDHIDIIEIDAASNTGVDDVRELREKAYISPAQAKYKVYIIDEVHMLSKAAFNALLKILEEPPAHVVFILATTEAHKIPPTVASRTQRFGFRPIPQALLSEHVLNIAKKEKIKISQEAADLIAGYSKGSFRDAISLLDQLQHTDGAISPQSIRQSLGQLDDERLQMITQAVSDNNIEKILNALNEAYKNGAQSVEIAVQLAQFWRRMITSDETGMDQSKIISLIEQLLEVKQSSDPELLLEIILVKSIELGGPGPSEKKPQTDTTLEQSEKTNVADTAPRHTNKPLVDSINKNQWNNVLSAVKESNNSLYALLRMCHMVSDSQKLTLTFGFPFHYRRMLEKRNQDILNEAIKTQFAEGFEIEYILDEASQKPVPPVKVKEDKSEEVLNLLGGEMVNL